MSIQLFDYSMSYLSGFLQAITNYRLSQRHPRLQAEALGPNAWELSWGGVDAGRSVSRAPDAGDYMVSSSYGMVIIWMPRLHEIGSIIS